MIPGGRRQDPCRVPLLFLSSVRMVRNARRSGGRRSAPHPKGRAWSGRCGRAGWTGASAEGRGRRKGRGSTRRGWICGRRVCAVAEERPAAGRPKKPRAGRPKDRQAFRMRGMRVIFLQRCRNICHSLSTTGRRNCAAPQWRRLGSAVCHGHRTTGRRNDRVGVSGRASAERMPDAR